MENAQMFKGIEMLAFGLVIIANEYVLKLNPWLVLGGLIAIGGLALMMNPVKSCCSEKQAHGSKPKRK